MVPVPVLIEGTLRLQPFSLDDVGAYAHHFVDYEVVRHLSSKVPWPYPSDGVAAFFNHVMPRQGLSRWSWTLRREPDPDVIIGAIELWTPGIPEHRGFWLGRPFWGNGYMTLAADLVNRFAFEQLDVDRLVLSNAHGNDRSRRVKERQGARFIGLRPASFVDPRYTHAEIWEITKSDWSTSPRQVRGTAS